MRVLHVVQPIFDGGLARAVMSLADAQRRRGWEVLLGAPDGELADQARTAGFTVHPWHGRRRPLSLVAGTNDLRRLVAGTRPDLVHLHSSWAGLAGRLAVRGGTPTIFQPHAWSFRGVRPPMTWLAVWWERWAVRWTSVVLCVSDGERQSGVDHRIAASWEVVTNPVDHHEVAYGSDEVRVEVRRRLGLSEHPLVVCPGRLCRQKGQDVLLEAWPEVRAEVPDARLVLVGDGPWRDRFAADASSGIDVVGWRHDVVDWLHAADVVVLPSRWEGMSIGMLEAMAAGRSIVSSDVEGAREALGEGDDVFDRAGAVVPIEDPAAIATSLALRLGDPVRAAREGRAGRVRVESRYGVDRWAERMERVASEVVTGR